MGFLSRLRSRSISPSAAASDEGLLLVDVRTPDEFRSGHAPSARNVPLDGLERHLGEIAAAERPVAFVCRSGARSATAARLARTAGVEARNVSGGMLGWSRAGLPVEQGD